MGTTYLLGRTLTRWRRLSLLLFGLCILIVVAAAGPKSDDDSYWVEPMKKVHEKFAGTKGTFAHFGDSITVSMAFWTALQYQRKNAPPQMDAAFALVKGYMRPECWREWKGPQFGNEGGMTIRWAHKNVATWLAKLNPEVALIMFGTNDLGSVPLDAYEAKTREVVKKCLDNGTVVILSTIPPRHGQAEKAAKFAEAVRKIACDLNAPLVDYHAEILKRRPDDWDGAMETFSGHKDYDVPTLIARDGVHPSHPAKYRDDYSDEALRCDGYGLRNYLVLMKYAQAIERLTLRIGGETAMATDLQVVDDYLAKWDRFAQGKNELVPSLRENMGPFESALTRLLNAKDKRAPARMVFYSVVQVGGSIPVDSDLGSAAAVREKALDLVHVYVNIFP